MKTNLLKTNLLILALLFMSNSMMAQQVSHIWENLTAGGMDATGAWEDPSNWRNGSMPGTDALGRAIFRGGTITIETNVSGDYRLELGDNKNTLRSKLTIKNGGHVGANRTVDGHSEVGIWAPATLIIEEGGSLTTGTHFFIGSTKHYSIRVDDTDIRNPAANMGSEVHLNGGTITVGEMFGIDFYNDKETSGGTLFMNGGLLDLAQWKPVDPEGLSKTTSLGKHGKIEYKGGTIRIKGDHKASLESFKTADKITGDFVVWTERTISDDVDTYVTFLTKEKPAANDATLRGLKFASGTLSPAFDPETHNYTVNLPVETTVAPTINATIYDGAEAVITPAANILSADEADRTATIEVTAEDGVTKLTYTIVFELLVTSVSKTDLEKMSIYPNPATSELYISNAVKVNRVEIFNITGSKVLSQNFSNEAIDISDLKAGLYFISIIDVNNNNIVRRFIKQ
jgi:hypothetical protein